MSTAADIFVQAFKSNRIPIVIIALVCFGLAAVGVFTALNGETGAGTALAVGFGIIGLGLMAMVVFKDPTKQPIVKALHADNDAVARITYQRLLVNGVHSNTTITLELNNGSKVAGVVRPKWEQAALEALMQDCPLAAFGDGTGTATTPRQDNQSAA